MGNIIELANTLRSIDILAELDKAVFDNQSVLLKNYQEKQLREGKNEDDTNIGVYFSKSYAELKGHSFVDLKFSGDQDKGMTIGKNGDAYQISSDVPYFPKNVDAYGVKWLGWNEESKKANKPIILESILKSIREKIGI